MSELKDVKVYYARRRVEQFDRMIELHPHATFFHTSMWGELLSKSGYADVYHVSINDIALAPMCITRSRRVPLLKVLRSVLGAYGYPLILNTQKKGDEVVKLLLDGLRRAALSCGCAASYIYLPRFLITKYRAFLKLDPRIEYKCLRLNIDGMDAEEIWRHKLTKKRRNAIRKAIKMNVEVRRVKTLSDLKEYYKMYLHTAARRKIGKIHSFKFFEELFKGLDTKYYLWLLALKDGVPIAGLLAFSFNNVMYVYSNVSYEEYWIYHPNDLLYWYVIEYASNKRFRAVDFGATTRGTLYHFKKSFGAEDVEVYRVWVLPPVKIIRAILA